jgi:hypothetical protein
VTNLSAFASEIRSFPALVEVTRDSASAESLQRPNTVHSTGTTLTEVLPEHKTNTKVWKILRLRKDKNKANSPETLEATMQAMQENIRLDELLKLVTVDHNNKKRKREEVQESNSTHSKKLKQENSRDSAVAESLAESLVLTQGARENLASMIAAWQQDEQCELEARWIHPAWTKDTFKAHLQHLATSEKWQLVEQKVHEQVDTCYQIAPNVVLRCETTLTGKRWLKKTTLNTQRLDSLHQDCCLLINLKREEYIDTDQAIQLLKQANIQQLVRGKRRKTFAHVSGNFHQDCTAIQSAATEAELLQKKKQHEVYEVELEFRHNPWTHNSDHMHVTSLLVFCSQAFR